MGNQHAATLHDSDLAALLEANHWQELTDAAQRVLERLGLDGFMKKMRISDGAGRLHVHVLSTLPENLYGGFSGIENDDSDPICKHVNRQGIPLPWDIDALCKAAPTLPYQALKNIGIQGGWSVAVRSEHSFSRIDVYSRSPRNFALAELQSDLLLLSCYLNDAARALWLRQHPVAKVPVLTVREQQCLRWSASGKTSNEIGMILGISQNTVYFHLKKAASKFEVYGTRHAISRAMEIGLI